MKLAAEVERAEVSEDALEKKASAIGTLISCVCLFILIVMLADQVFRLEARVTALEQKP